MKALKIGLFAFGMLAVMNVQGQEERPQPKPVKEIPAKKHKARKHFNKMDANKDGVIILSELKKAKGKEAKDHVNRFNRMDKNSDAQVTFEEFKAMKKVKNTKKMKKAKKKARTNNAARNR